MSNIFPIEGLDRSSRPYILYMDTMNSEVSELRILLSNDSAKPIYEQILDQVKDLILKGSLQPGDPLPSIRALARDLSISVITTKRAYDELERERFIETVQGKGSFVALQDNALMQERLLHAIEDKLSQALLEARLMGLDYADVERMLRILWEE